jgi:hypothetical protein
MKISYKKRSKIIAKVRQTFPRMVSKVYNLC